MVRLTSGYQNWFLFSFGFIRSLLYEPRIVPIFVTLMICAFPEEEPLLEDFDDEAATAPWEFYQVGRAEYRPFHDKMQDESKIYFVPSMRPGIT